MIRVPEIRFLSRPLASIVHGHHTAHEIDQFLACLVLELCLCPFAFLMVVSCRRAIFQKLYRQGTYGRSRRRAWTISARDSRAENNLVVKGKPYERDEMI